MRRGTEFRFSILPAKGTQGEPVRIRIRFRDLPENLGASRIAKWEREPKLLVRRDLGT
jgi:hypothetical protein